ncbi:putative POTRA domain-containing protein [Gammaproteobacteria bacterium]
MLIRYVPVMNIDAKGIKSIHKLALTIALVICLALLVQSAKGDFPPISTFDPGRIKEYTPEEEPRNLNKPREILEQPKSSLPKPQKNASAVKFKLSNLVVSGVTVYKKGELLRYYKSYLGKDISLSDLQVIADAITEHYRGQGYVLSRAVVPAQQIIAGKVYIQVIEGYVNAVYVVGDMSKMRAKIEKYGEKIKQMRPLQVRKLERYILLLNDIPGLTIKTVLSPAVATVGASELTFVVEQRRIIVDAYYDNRGSRYLGPDEVVASASFADAVLAADNLLLQTIDTPIHDELRYLKLGYSCPLGMSGLRVNANGSLTETHPGFTIESLGLIGRSKDWIMGVEYPLMRTRTKKLLVYGKFELMDSYTNFPGVKMLYQDHIRSVRFGASYDFQDQWVGDNILSLDFSKGLHGLGASPLNPQTPLSRPYGRSDYSKVDASVTRYQALGSRWMLLSSTTGQYSFRNILLSAEQFSFGGPQFGRAYDPSEIIGDSGIASKLELRANTYPEKRFLQQIQYYSFYEIGATWNVSPDMAQPNKDSGTDLGAGLRATFNKYFYGNLEIAKPLTRPVATQVASGKNGKAWRMYFSLGAKL